MEPNNGGLEDDVPFQLGDLYGSMFIFWYVFARAIKKRAPVFFRAFFGDY